MHFLSLAAVVGAAVSGVDAAPRGFFSKNHDDNHAGAKATERREPVRPQERRNHAHGPVTPEFNHILRRGHSLINTTELTRPVGKLVNVPLDAVSADHQRLVDLDCPAVNIIVTTTTIDVTVFVTPSLPTEEPCDDETPIMTPEVTLSLSEVSTEPCDEETTFPVETPTDPGEIPCTDETTSIPGIVFVVPTPSPSNSSWSAYESAMTTPSEEPCDTGPSTPDPSSPTSLVVIVSAPLSTSGSPSATWSAYDPGQGNATTIAVLIPTSSAPVYGGSLDPSLVPSSEPAYPTTLLPNSSITASPSTPYDPLSTEPCDEQETFTSAAFTPTTESVYDPITSRNVSVTPCTTDPGAAATTPAPINISVGIVIDINIAPVTTSKLTATPTAPAQPTKTVCVHEEENGSTSPDTAYCGIHGAPAGTYFIAEFIEERPGVPVTEEGCYQFCDSVMEATEGCQSYRFYTNDLGAPRCSLYGMPVSASVRDLDANQPDLWFDLVCGSPTEQLWHRDMPESHWS